MNKLKKILSVVLSIGLVASTLVLPMTAEAAVAAANVAYEYNFNDGDLNVDSGSYNAGAITSEYTGGTVSVVDGVGGKSDKVAMISRSTAAADLQTRVTNAYTEIFADSNKMTAEVEIYVPAIGVTDTAGMGFIVLTNTTGMGDSVYAKIEFDKWSVWTGSVTANGAANANTWTKNDTAANVAGNWHKLGVTATKATSTSAADGSMELYVDGALVKTITGLQIDKFYPDVRVTSQYRGDLSADGACKQYFDNLKVYKGDYDPGYADKKMWLEFTDSADITRIGGTQTDGLAGKVATDKVTALTAASTRDYAEFETTSGVVTYEASVYAPSGSVAQLHVYNTKNSAIRHAVVFRGNGNFGVDTNADGGDVWDNINNADANVATYNMNTWNKVAIEYNTTAGTVKFYLNGSLVETITATAAAPEKFSRDLAFFGISGGTVYVDNMRVYTNVYQADEAIAVTGASNGVITVNEGATLADITAKAAGMDRAVVYSDAALTTEATSLDDAQYLLVQNDELYNTYTLNITSPYGTKYVWYDFTDASDATDIGSTTQADGIMGKDASDKIGYVSGTAKFGSAKWGTYYTDDVITAEVQVYPSSKKIELFPASNKNGENRPGVYIKNGKFGYVRGGDWIYEDICDVDANMWHKIAIQYNKATSSADLYLDGVLMKTVSNISYASAGLPADIALQDDGYVDNFHVYAAAYQADPAITVASTDKVTVSGTTLKATEGVTLNELAATVTAGTAKFYTDTTLATQTTDVNAATVMLVNNGEIYKKYTIEIVSAYGDKYVWKDFTNASDITDMAGSGTNVIADGFAGKPASDKVAQIAEHTGWKGGTWSDNIITAEVQAFVPSDGIISLYSGTAIDGKDRPGVYIQNGKIGYVKANSWTYTSVADITDTTIWHKMAIEMNKSTGVTKIYLDGVKVYEGTDFAYGSSHSQDWRIQSKGYIDNWHIYNAAYVQDEAIATPSAVADGKFVIADGQTLADALATVTDGTAKFYTDTTYATEATSTANVGYILINKGELYKAYPVKVASKYDGAILSTNFNGGAIDYAGDFAGNAVGSWYNVNTGATATTSYTQLGGKDSKAFTVTAPAYGEGTRTNARLQTGWGAANAKYSSGVYTVEGQLWKDQAVHGGGIAIKMRSESGSNTNFTVDAPAVANEWIKLALTVDTVNGTIQGYINGEPVDTNLGTSLTVDGVLYNIVSDQANLNACDNADVDVVTALDNFRVYSGAYKGDTMPTIAESVTMAAGATVADIITETGADFVVDATGNVVSSSTVAATGMKAVKVNGECYGYCDVTATALTTDVAFSTLAKGEVYEKDGVEYVFVAVTTGTITDISLYDTFRVTDGVEVKEMALSELMGTTLTGAAEIGVLVMNVPAANADNFQAKLVLAD